MKKARSFKSRHAGATPTDNDGQDRGDGTIFFGLDYNGGSLRIAQKAPTCLTALTKLTKSTGLTT